MGRLLWIPEPGVDPIVKQRNDGSENNACKNRKQQETRGIVRVRTDWWQRDIQDAQVRPRLRFGERDFLIAGFEHSVQVLACCDLPDKTLLFDYSRRYLAELPGPRFNSCAEIPLPYSKRLEHSL